MSRPTIYYWAPSMDTNPGDGYQDGIALLQSVAENENVVLFSNTPNGVFSYINTINLLTSVPNVSADLIRSIAIWSTDDTDNSDVTFVIKGIGCPSSNIGNIPFPLNSFYPIGPVGPISEELQGPGPGPNTSVTSGNFYTVINSITVTQANAVNITVGYGAIGMTNYYRRDTNRDSIATPGITYSVQFVNTFVDGNPDNDPNPFSIDFNSFIAANLPEYPTINGGLVPWGQINGKQLLGANISPTTQPFLNIRQIDSNIVAGSYNSGIYSVISSNSIDLSGDLSFAVFFATVGNFTDGPVYGTDSFFLNILQQGSR